MGVPRQIDGLKSICLIPGASDFTLHGSGPWKRLSRYPGLATALTVVGAGAAILALRYSGNPPRGASLYTPFVWSWPKPLVNELTVPGLKNTGNSCFLNVILQALASSEEFVAFLAHDCQLASRSNDSLHLAEPLLELLNELSATTSGRKVADSGVVMHLLERSSRGFDLNRQQDAAEFLARLAELLRTERNAFFHRLQPDVDSFADVPLVACDLNPSARRSRVVSEDSKRQRLLCPLEGRTQSSMCCQQCGHKFPSNLEGFTSIPLPLPSNDGAVIEGCDLDLCLNQFTSIEVVSDFTCIQCTHRASAGLQQEQEQLKYLIRGCSLDDGCLCEGLTTGMGGTWKKVTTQVHRRLMISCAPKVLCLQIPRAMSIISDGSAQPQKWKGHVKFPTTLDLSRYMMTWTHTDSQETSSCLSMQSAGNAGDPSSLVPGQERTSEITSAERRNPSPVYELLSVVEHQGGGTDSGHFAVYRRVRLSRQKFGSARLHDHHHNSAEVSLSGPVVPIVWFRVSDTEVARVSEEDVLKAEASLLFYQQIAA